MKRLGVLVVAMIGLAGYAAAPAAAGGYPPQNNILTVSDTTPCPGQSFTVTAQKFQPGTPVTVTLLPNAVLGTPTAGDDGTVSLNVTLSATQAQGAQTIQAQGAGVDEVGQVLTLTGTIKVESCNATPPTTSPAAAGGGGGNLPRTGSDSTLPLLKIGGALAAIGGVLVALAATRKRRAHHFAH
jgi:hypothetical protein